MLRQMVDEFDPLLVPLGKQIVVEAPDDIYLLGDADKLARVFNNILKNAIAYSHPESIIKINAEQQGKSVVISFVNYGNPIPSQQLDRIFEKFFRLDPSNSTLTGGTGLGLAIARKIVEAHGGTIIAQSSEKYTAFVVTLPMAGHEISGLTGHS